MSGLDLTAILARYEAAQHYADKRLPALADIPALVEAVRKREDLLVRSRQFAIHHPGAGCTDEWCSCGVVGYLQRLNSMLGYGPSPKPAPDLHEAADALWTALRNAKGEPFDPAILEAMAVYEEARGIRG